MGDMMNKVTKSVLAAAAVATAFGGFSAPAFAQRDPAYAAARADGEIGEKMDGYLGIVGAETPALRKIVNDINIKRRAVYSDRAKANNATLEEYALTAGCQAILEKYQAPNGSWETRGAGAPQRDPRCP